MKDKIRKIKESISNAPHKKKTIIAVIVALCMVGGATAGYQIITHTDNSKASIAQQELEKAKESGDKDAIAKAEKKLAEAKKEKAEADKKEAAKDKQVASSNTSSKSSSQSSSSNSSGNGGSYHKPSRPSSGSSASKPSKPTHHHSWSPVYGTRQVAYQEDIGGTYVTVCTNCGEELTLESYREHQENHLLNGESTGRKEIYKPHYVTKYRTEKCIKYYKCSCGATKQ